MINFSKVSYQYHQDKFDFDLNISQGNIVAILGASGAGKSTLLSLLAGFIHPNTGNIFIAGQAVDKFAPHQRPLAMLFQEHNLFSHLTVQDNIALGLQPSLKLTSQQLSQVVEVSQQVEVDALLTRLPDQLSGGQRQRVALARCFIQKRPVLLLDEPFSALDPLLRSAMLARVKTLASAEQVTVLMVTHHLSDANNIASHFVFINQGQARAVEEISLLTINHPDQAISKFVAASL
jgi:thiamine transport system ATP-binding protein